jgi:hypothetical protein
MADKPLSQFERRSQHGAVPASRLQQPAKRSNHVALLVMGTLAVGGGAYALMPRECTPVAPGTMPAVSSPSECPPRGSSSSHGGSSRYGYTSGGSSSSTPAASTDAGSGGVRRGGFGAFAHSFSSHFSFGG